MEKEMATHSSILAWRIPGMAEPGGLLSVGLHRVGHDWHDLAAAAAYTIYTLCMYVCIHIGMSMCFCIYTYMHIHICASILFKQILIAMKSFFMFCDYNKYIMAFYYHEYNIDK